MIAKHTQKLLLLTLFLIPISCQAYVFTELVLIMQALDKANQRNRRMVMESIRQVQGKPPVPPQEQQDATPRGAFYELAGELPEDVIEIIEFMRNSEKFSELGASMPKGILLEGPPGTGKTCIARCIAESVGAAFFPATGSQFVDLYVGQGPRNVRELFDKAEQAIAQGYPRAIIFIDEIDAVGRKRGGFHSQEYDNTVNELLNKMDGFAQNPKIFIIGATNHAKALDPALLRPGRFDRIVKISLPDADNRKAILQFYIDKLPKVQPDLEYDRLVRASKGFSGADIKNLVNEAAIFAARASAKRVEQTHLDQALDKMKKMKRDTRRR